MADTATATSGKSKVLSNGSMLLGLAASYGFFGWMALRFLFPAKAQERAWLFVSETNKIEPGASLRFRTPTGVTVNVTRQGDGGTVDDFIALSSTCPHLGCQVHWEGQHGRYFCPCHNGTFDAKGVGTGGPPGDAGQSLPRYPLRVDAGLLFLEAPVESLTTKTAQQDAGHVIETVEGVSGPGHDPCLARLKTVDGRRFPTDCGGERS